MEALISVDESGQLVYALAFCGKEVVAPSAIGLTLGDKDFGKVAKFVVVGKVCAAVNSVEQYDIYAIRMFRHAATEVNLSVTVRSFEYIKFRIQNVIHLLN